MIYAVVGLSLLWVALSRSLDVQSALAGVGAAVLVVLVQRLLFPGVAPVIGSLIRRPHRLLAYAAALLWRLAVSTVYTSWLILSGRGEGRIMALPLRVGDPLGRFVLLNSITLTPSTISLLAQGDTVYIHQLQDRTRSADWRSAKEAIETRILAIFARTDDADR